MRALFVSDVHASAERPDAVVQLCALLECVAGRLDALYVLGDLFDQWLGDDDTGGVHAAVERALGGLVAAGAAVHVQHGNHDFLLGTGFEARTGCCLLEDPALIELDGTRTVLMHGDSLCADDHEYQAYRRYTRDRTNQRRFLALGLAERQAMAVRLRHESADLKQLKPADIMDVSEAAVHEVLRAHRARLLIHGHTHRPAIHELSVDGARARRMVLGDWYGVGRVGVHSAGRTELLAVPEAMRRWGTVHTFEE